MIGKNFDKKGVALFIVVVITLTVSAVSAAYISTSIANKNRVESLIGVQKALYAAETGANYALRLLADFTGDVEDDRVPTANDTLAAVPELSPGLRYDASAELLSSDETEHNYRITSVGIYGNHRKTIRMSLRGDITHNVFFHAIYAANQNLNGQPIETSPMSFSGCPRCQGTGVITVGKCSKCNEAVKKNLGSVTSNTAKYVMTCAHDWKSTSEPFITGKAAYSGHANGCTRNSDSTATVRWYSTGENPARECRYVAPVNSTTTYQHYQCQTKGYDNNYCDANAKLVCGNATAGHNWYNTYSTVTSSSHTTHGCSRSNPTSPATTAAWWYAAGPCFLRCTFVPGTESAAPSWRHERCKNSCILTSGQYLKSCSHSNTSLGATYKYTSTSGHAHGCNTTRCGTNAYWRHTDNRWYKCTTSTTGQAEGWQHWKCNIPCRFVDGASWRVCPAVSNGGCNGNGTSGVFPCPVCGGQVTANGQAVSATNPALQIGGTPRSKANDMVTGQVYNVGDVNLNYLSFVDGKVKAFNGIVNPVDGNYNIPDDTVNYNTPDINENICSNYDEIEPPNLAAMNYKQNAQTGSSSRWDPITNPNGKYINVSNEFTSANGGTKIPINGQEAGFRYDSIETVPAGSPAHIFCRDAYDSISTYNLIDSTTLAAMTTTQKNDWLKRQYFLMDLQSGPKTSGVCTNGGEKVTISTDHNNKVYFIDGNLWIESNGKGPTVTTAGSAATRPDLRATFVVSGNIYICDALYYDKTRDGLAFIAIAGGEETYVDLNGDNKFGSGDILLNDQPNSTGQTGTYDGPPEGRGNVYFGDPSGTANNTVCWMSKDVNGNPTDKNKNNDPMNVFHGYLYSENDFLDKALSTSGVTPFEVYGMYCAGGRMKINRDFYDSAKSSNAHAGMTVTYDDRIQELKLPGLPRDNHGRPTQWTLTGYAIVGN